MTLKGGSHPEEGRTGPAPSLPGSRPQERPARKGRLWAPCPPALTGVFAGRPHVPTGHGVFADSVSPAVCFG